MNNSQGPYFAMCISLLLIVYVRLGDSTSVLFSIVVLLLQQKDPSFSPILVLAGSSSGAFRVSEDMINLCPVDGGQ